MKWCVALHFSRPQFDALALGASDRLGDCKPGRLRISFIIQNDVHSKSRLA